MNRKAIGIFESLFSALLWGIGGNFTQYIFSNSNLNFPSLVFIRMLISSLIFITIGVFIYGKSTALNMIKDIKIVLNLIIYGILGIFGVQFPFFATIKYSNAAFATLMQFGAPIIVITYVSVKNRKKPKNFELAATSIILIGLFLVITNGKLSSLIFDENAIFYGLLAAMGFAFYIGYADRFSKWPTIFTIGYGMLIGSIFSILFIKDTQEFIYILRPDIFIAFILLIILGTVIPFYFFVESTRYISADITCILSVGEPLTAIFISVIFFNNTFTILQIIGILLILTSIFIIGFFTKNNE